MTALTGFAAVKASETYRAQARRQTADASVHDRDGLSIHAAKARLAAYLLHRAAVAEFTDPEPRT